MEEFDNLFLHDNIARVIVRNIGYFGGSPMLALATAVRHYLHEVLGIPTPNVKPVSYTHLDVYKRQHQKMAIIGNEQSLICLLYTSRCV